MQKTAYEMRISDWSSDVCSSDLIAGHEKLLAKKRSANSLGTRGFSQIIMGTIARDAKKRDLACSAWRQAVRDFPDLEKRDELLGNYKEFLPRSEERRVGEEGVSPGGSRGSRFN